MEIALINDDAIILLILKLFMKIVKLKIFNKIKRTTFTDNIIPFEKN